MRKTAWKAQNGESGAAPASTSGAEKVSSSLLGLKAMPDRASETYGAAQLQVAEADATCSQKCDAKHEGRPMECCMPVHT